MWDRYLFLLRIILRHYNRRVPRPRQLPLGQADLGELDQRHVWVYDIALLDQPLDLVDGPLLLAVDSHPLADVHLRRVCLLHNHAVAGASQARRQDGLCVVCLPPLLPVKQEAANNHQLGVVAGDDGHAAGIWVRESQEALLELVADVG